MTVRAYLSRVGSPELHSTSYKREIIQLERKDVERVVFRPELNLLQIYNANGVEEAFDYHLCDVEVLQKEPTDGLTDGLQVSL